MTRLQTFTHDERLAIAIAKLATAQMLIYLNMPSGDHAAMDDVLRLNEEAVKLARQVVHKRSQPYFDGVREPLDDE
jgi:hypothetical protein